MEGLVPALSLKINVSGVYISYPFCAQKCTYCNFASGVFPRELEARYRQAVAREIEAHAWEWTPDTLYLGGGTPSNLAPDDLRELLDLVPGRPWAEATIEAAPGNLTPEKASDWTAAGINRVSFGVQSFVEKELRRTGRAGTGVLVGQLSVAAWMVFDRVAVLGMSEGRFPPQRRASRPTSGATTSR